MNASPLAASMTFIYILLFYLRDIRQLTLAFSYEFAILTSSRPPTAGYPARP
jgi:hypothetical protein